SGWLADDVMAGAARVRPGVPCAAGARTVREARDAGCAAPRRAALRAVLTSRSRRVVVGGTELVVQRRARDAQQPGGRQLVAAGGDERLADRAHLELGDRLRQWLAG